MNPDGKNSQGINSFYAGWTQCIDTASIADTPGKPVGMLLVANAPDNARGIPRHLRMVDNLYPECRNSAAVIDRKTLLNVVANLHPTKPHFSFQ